MTQEKRKIPISGLVDAAIVAVLLALLAMGIAFFSRYTSGQLYQESINQLTEISSQLFEKLEVQLNIHWSYLAKMDDTQKHISSMTTQELAEFLRSREEELSPVGESLQFIAVDEYDYYYTAQGKQGVWTGASNLSSDATQQSFLVTDWLTNENMMVFVRKLESPLTVGNAAIQYFAVLKSMEDMAPYFRSSAFHNQNTTYVIDKNGVKMFTDSVTPELDFGGRNIFYALHEETYPHLGSFDACLAAVQQDGFICTDVVVGSSSYYMALKQLDGYDWSMLFFVPADEVATSTRAMTNSMVRVFIVVLTVVLLLCLLSFLFVTRFRKNQELLAIKTRSEAQLAEANKKLEGTNAQLEASNTKLAQAQTAAAKALEVAEKASQAKTEFLSNMSHDIRTPMNAIMGIARLMQNEPDLTDKMHTYIAKILMSSQHLLSLINDVLDMSRIESSEVKLNEEPVSLAEQIGQVESIIRPQVDERGQSFTIRVHNVAHEYLIGDGVRLRQVFINLLSNAVKYTPYNGRVQLDLAELPCPTADHATFRITVSDNGCGMTPEYMKHIFEPFSRAENSTTNKVQGTGLGMAITKNIVDLMHGEITVESQLNKGSTFTVTLTFPIDRSMNKKVDIGRILLISTDEVLTNNMRAALQESAVPFSTAATEAEARKILAGQKVEVILLAGHLHDKTLSQTVRLLRGAAKDAVLIFCCDYEQQENVYDILTQSGVDGLIPRPFFLSNLIHAIEHIRGKDTAEAEERSAALNGVRFLCAEDNEINAEILSATLEMHGASCTIYSNGKEIAEAFEKVKPGDYDMILMDVMMPVMDGLDATRAIRNGKNPLGKTIPIVAMTANAFTEDIQKSQEAGMDAHLSKPMDIESLKRTVQRFRVTPPPENKQR